MEIHISVRSLVEFILRSGDIDNRRAAAPDNAMQEGSKIHRMIQRRMGPEYQAEVGLKYIYDAGEYEIIVEGRADGIITENLPEHSVQTAGQMYLDVTEQIKPESALLEGKSREDGTEVYLPEKPLQAQSVQKVRVTIDEIKGVFRDLKKMKDAVPVHLAQAKCYAYIYAAHNGLEAVRVRMTYCHIETEEIRYFHYDYTYRELQAWFGDVMKQYRKWSDYHYAWQRKRKASIKELVFPYSYREGQKELASDVYRTIYHKRKLFIEAPTGVGKTISTVFPAVKAMGEDLCEKIFYLTAKTITRTVADHTFALLREHGLQLKSVVLTAKDKICFMEETECNPEHCPYAKGHYDRINEAMYDLLIHEDVFNREKIEEYAKRHVVCRRSHLRL